MPDDIAKARARNQALVRAQRQVLGLDKSEWIEFDGYASSTLELTKMEKQPTEDALAAEIERVKAELVEHVAAMPKTRLGVVSAMNLVNGDIEVRAMFRQTMRREDAH